MQRLVNRYIYCVGIFREDELQVREDIISYRKLMDINIFLGLYPDVRDGLGNIAREICLLVIKKNGGVIQFVPKELRDKEMWLLATKNKDLLWSEELIEEAKQYMDNATTDQMFLIKFKATNRLCYGI